MLRHLYHLEIPWAVHGHRVTTGPHRHLWWPITLLARIIHECRREAFETEVRRGLSQVMPTEAYVQSVEEAEREKPRRARGSDDVAGIHE